MKIPALKWPWRKSSGSEAYGDHRDSGDEPKRVQRYADYVPVAGIIVGFALIAVGWNGAASWDCVQCQIPYLISGGVVGLGIVFFAAAALIVQTLKKGNARQQEELEALNRNLERVASALSFSANGHSDNGDLVVVGSSSFHLPTCRTVGNREVVQVPRDEAIAEGLDPCRICNP